MESSTAGEILLQHENEARQILIEYYRGSYGDQVNQQVDLLLDLGGYIDRFNYLSSVLGDRLKLLPKIMISGYSAGSEMIVARQFGFQEVYGVEVNPALLRATEVRLTDIPGMFPTIYDGSFLPYRDNEYYLVVSGHIIEHTISPEYYLYETMRVLKNGGILYIEFPSRYHYIELHTGQLSFEWLPTSLRNSALRLLSSRYSILSQATKSKYGQIVSGRLKQVSRRDIFHWLKGMGINYKEIAYSKPAPGIIRCIIQKLGTER